ncbi:glutathione S-transferase [Lactarius quietus]|nr:glutathione S-transferase [Lactarius quietus]
MSHDVFHFFDISKSKTEADGLFKPERNPSSFRNFIQVGGQFPLKKARLARLVSNYLPNPHLDRSCRSLSSLCQTASLAWATRTLILRKLKGLEDIISFTVVSPRMGAEGWPFASVDQFPTADVDPLYESKHAKVLYLRADPNFSGRFTVPVLWDKKQHTIVNNESSEIIHMFNSDFDGLVPEDKAKLDLYPEELRKEIDEVNELFYDKSNSALHSHYAFGSGFATSFQAYRDAVTALFDALDRVEGTFKGKEISHRQSPDRGRYQALRNHRQHRLAEYAVR